jgi:hypothetical protein
MIYDQSEEACAPMVELWHRKGLVAKEELSDEVGCGAFTLPQGP